MTKSQPIPHIQIIVGSVREGRLSRPVADWVAERLEERGDLTCELIDLADWAFPQFSLGRPPAMGSYEDRRQIAWARTIARGDAFLFVGPEYNHGYSGVLKTALDYLMAEWQDKPAACVSFGNVGGARMVENLQAVFVELGIIPSAPSTHLRGAHGKRDGAIFAGDESDETSLHRTVDRLLHWTSLTHGRQRSDESETEPRVLVLGLGDKAIASVVLPLRRNRWKADGVTVPDALVDTPDASRYDIVTFGRGALGVDAEHLKSLFRKANPEVRLVETFLPIAVRQIEAAHDAWAGRPSFLHNVSAGCSTDQVVVEADIAMNTRLGVTAYTIDGRIASERLADIKASSGAIRLQIPQPGFKVSGLVIDADGAEFVHIPILPDQSAVEEASKDE